MVGTAGVVGGVRRLPLHRHGVADAVLLGRGDRTRERRRSRGGDGHDRSRRVTNDVRNGHERAGRAGPRVAHLDCVTVAAVAAQRLVDGPLPVDHVRRAQHLLATLLEQVHGQVGACRSRAGDPVARGLRVDHAGRGRHAGRLDRGEVLQGQPGQCQHPVACHVAVAADAARPRGRRRRRPAHGAGVRKVDLGLQHAGVAFAHRRDGDVADKPVACVVIRGDPLREADVDGAAVAQLGGQHLRNDGVQRVGRRGPGAVGGERRRVLRGLVAAVAVGVDRDRGHLVLAVGRRRDRDIHAGGAGGDALGQLGARPGGPLDQQLDGVAAGEVGQTHLGRGGVADDLGARAGLAVNALDVRRNGADEVRGVGVGLVGRVQFGSVEHVVACVVPVGFHAVGRLQRHSWHRVLVDVVTEAQDPGAAAGAGLGVLVGRVFAVVALNGADSHDRLEPVHVPTLPLEQLGGTGVHRLGEDDPDLAGADEFVTADVGAVEVDAEDVARDRDVAVERQVESNVADCRGAGDAALLRPAKCTTQAQRPLELPVGTDKKVVLAGVVRGVVAQSGLNHLSVADLGAVGRQRNQLRRGDDGPRRRGAGHDQPRIRGVAVANRGVTAAGRGDDGVRSGFGEQREGRQRRKHGHGEQACQEQLDGKVRNGAHCATSRIERCRWKATRRDNQRLGGAGVTSSCGVIWEESGKAGTRVPAFPSMLVETYRLSAIRLPARSS